ncbi:MAG: hypothetical protein JXA78_12265 [Anaerolineales bacterium]|nr:hypothetical protein [Anaerolineales bacterium]
MLTKSVKSAIILSAITVISFSMSGAMVNMLIPYLTSGDICVVIESPQDLQSPGDVIALIGLVAGLLLILTGISAFWLYRFFGERYYGARGALRWAVFGAIFALLLWLPDWLFPESLRFLGHQLRFLGVLVAFFVARWLIPVERGLRQADGDKS